jgi:hypothetical protein
MVVHGEKAVTAGCVRRVLQTGDKSSFAGAASARRQFHTSTSAGVGFQPLQGLLSCGQLEISTMTLHSARSSTYFPGAEMPSSKVNPPWGHRHVHKEVDVGANIALLQATIMQAGAQEIVAAAVHMAFIEA